MRDSLCHSRGAVVSRKGQNGFGRVQGGMFQAAHRARMIEVLGVHDLSSLSNLLRALPGFQMRVACSSLSFSFSPSMLQIVIPVRQA